MNKMDIDDIETEQAWLSSRRDIMSNATASRIAANWWADRLQSGDKEKFRKSLQLAIFEELESGKKIVHTECDYDPRGILLDAVNVAGNDCGGFMFSAKGILPLKHSLEISATELQPKEGYGNWTDPIKVSE